MWRFDRAVRSDSKANNPNVSHVYQMARTLVPPVQESYMLVLYKTGSASVEAVSDFDLSHRLRHRPTPRVPRPPHAHKGWTLAVSLSASACNPEAENGFAQLIAQRLNVSFEVGCCDSFQGECAPEFDDLTALRLRAHLVGLLAQVLAYAFELQSDDSATHPSAAAAVGDRSILNDLWKVADHAECVQCVLCGVDLHVRVDDAPRWRAFGWSTRPPLSLTQHHNEADRKDCRRWF